MSSFRLLLHASCQASFFYCFCKGVSPACSHTKSLKTTSSSHIICTDSLFAGSGLCSNIALIWSMPVQASEGVRSISEICEYWLRTVLVRCKAIFASKAWLCPPGRPGPTHRAGKVTNTSREAWIYAHIYSWFFWTQFSDAFRLKRATVGAVRSLEDWRLARWHLFGIAV